MRNRHTSLKTRRSSAEIIQRAAKPRTALKYPGTSALTFFLKFAADRSDNKTNGDEQSEPGSGVSGQVFREEHLQTKLFAESEDDARRAQQASGFDRGQFKAEAKADRPKRLWRQCRRLPEVTSTVLEIFKWQ